MNELERVARMICAADGRDPDAPTWTTYTCYLMAALDVISPIALDRQPAISPAPDWRYTCTVATSSSPKGLP